MWDSLIGLDHQLFYFINRDLNHPIFAEFFKIFTNLHHLKWFSFGLVPILLFAWIVKEKKQGALKIGAMIVIVGTADLFSYRVVKQLTYRHRPNNHPGVASILKVEHGPKSSSIPSNHAMNTSALAATVSYFFPASRYIMWGLAGLIALSRVYVGVHFPSDVILGLLAGVLWFKMWLKIWVIIPRRKAA